MNPVDFLRLFHLQKPCVIDYVGPYALSKDSLLHRLLRSPPTPPCLFFNSFFTSFVKFDVFSVAPPPSQDELCAWCGSAAAQCCFTLADNYL